MAFFCKMACFRILNTFLLCFDNDFEYNDMFVQLWVFV